MRSAPSPAVRPVLVLLCLLAATGCDENSVAGPTVPISQRFTLSPGETAAISNTELRIRFDRVSGDSRCPADAICIQGGDAIVHIRATDDSASNDYELHTGDSSRASATHRSTKIQLLELQPYPFSSRTIAPGDYRATLVVNR